MQPLDVNTSGNGTGFHFSSVLEAHFFTINGKIGIPVGRVRIYGQGGSNYHSASLSTTQTNDDKQITTGGVSTTLPGGTQTIEIKTGGWGWQFGGGLEVWMKSWLGIYGEANRTRLKGDSVEGPQGELSDYITTVLGARQNREEIKRSTGRLTSSMSNTSVALGGTRISQVHARATEGRQVA